MAEITNESGNSKSMIYFVKCLQKAAEFRTNEEAETIFLHLRGMKAMGGYLESSVRVMSQTARYEEYDSNFLLYHSNDYASCWYILLTGCVFLEGCMYLPGSSFGKQPHGADGTRGTDCLVLERSGMIVIDYPHENLLQPFQRHSYSTSELEKLLALESKDFLVGGPVPEDDKLPMELQQVKDILLRSEHNLKKKEDKENKAHAALETKYSHSSEHLELDLSGLVESIVDSDDEEESASHSSQESFMVRDVVRDCLEKEPSERTESDIETLMDFMQHLPAFANMTQNVRRALCAVMVFAVVEKAGSVVMENGEELDSWSVILNGSVEIFVDGKETTCLHLGDSFGVEPSLKKMLHKGVMKTRVDDCQFVCIAQTDYYRILTQGKSNVKVIEEGGEVVMVTEHRSTDGGNREGEVVIKAKPEKLISHLVEDHSVIDPTFVEDFLLTFKTYFDQPSQICGRLLSWFLSKDYRDKVTRVMLLWVNNHYTDFEGDTAMENYLETFEKGLELQKMSGQLDLLNMACSAKAKSRVIVMDRPSCKHNWGFWMAGGKEMSLPIFVSKVETGSLAAKAGIKRGDQILDVDGKCFDNLTNDKAREMVSSSTHIKLTLKKNIAGFKELQSSPVIVTGDHAKNDNHGIEKPEYVQRSSSDCTEKRNHMQTRLSAPDITSGSNRKPPIPMQTQSKTDKVKKALTKFSTLGSLSRQYKLISKSDRDLTSVDSGFHEGDEVHNSARLGVKVRTRGSIPRAFGSMESLNTVEGQTNEYPDKVLRVYKADQTSKYFLIYKETTAREVIDMALETFGLPTNATEEYSLCEVTVEEHGLVRQRRLPDTLTNLADRIGLNARYYLKNNMETAQLLQGDATQELAKEGQVTLLGLNTQEVAKQLTLKDFELLRSVDSREYIYDVWEFPPELWTNLSKFSDIVNYETMWVVTEICSEPSLVKRMKLIKHFIKIAKYCKDCKNFNSAFAIISGLANMSVRRLKNTWDRLPTRYNKMYEDLENLMDPSRSMFKYRSLVNSANVSPPLIPFFPVIKRDLTLIYLNNKSVIDGLVNFEKLRMIAREVRQVVKCHSVPYDPATMFDQDSNASQSKTSQVVGMVTSGTTWGRRSLARDQNPKKMFEEAVMTRRVQKYLDNLLVILDEDKLREMSNACEPAQGSGPPSVQTRRKNSPATSPTVVKKEKKNSNRQTEPSPLASRRVQPIAPDRISVSSTTSTSSSLPDPHSPRPVCEPPTDVFHESDSSSSLREEFKVPSSLREEYQVPDSRVTTLPHGYSSDISIRYTQTHEHIETRRTRFDYPDNAESFPIEYSYPATYQDENLNAGSYHRGRYKYQHPPKYTVEYIQDFDESEEGQVSAV